MIRKRGSSWDYIYIYMTHEKIQVFHSKRSLKWGKTWHQADCFFYGGSSHWACGEKPLVDAGWKPREASTMRLWDPLKIIYTSSFLIVRSDDTLWYWLWCIYIYTVWWLKKHLDYFPCLTWHVILPSEFHSIMFQRGRRKTTNQIMVAG